MFDFSASNLSLVIFFVCTLHYAETKDLGMFIDTFYVFDRYPGKLWNYFLKLWLVMFKTSNRLWNDLVLVQCKYDSRSCGNWESFCCNLEWLFASCRCVCVHLLLFVSIFCCLFLSEIDPLKTYGLSLFLKSHNSVILCSCCLQFWPTLRINYCCIVDVLFMNSLVMWNFICYYGLLSCSIVLRSVNQLDLIKGVALLAVYLFQPMLTWKVLQAYPVVRDLFGMTGFPEMYCLPEKGFSRD